MIRRILLAIGLLLSVQQMVRAQPAEMPVGDPALGEPRSSLDGFAPPATAVYGPEYAHPLQSHPAPLGEPPWCDSPYRSSAWRVEIDLIPTISHVSEQGFGAWSNNGSLALRLNLGYEDADGIGTRILFWGFGDKQNTFAGDVELDAGTFYGDIYKRFYLENAELVLGAGPAGASMRYDLRTLHERAELNSGGISVFGEGFYPLWRFAKTDVGSIGRARFALLSGRWSDHGTPFVDTTNHDLLTIIELSWGLEIRRRFGKMEDKYWYIDIAPEFQRWESASLPDEFDPGFEGTAINFGLAW